MHQFRVKKRRLRVLRRHQQALQTKLKSISWLHGILYHYAALSLFLLGLSYPFVSHFYEPYMLLKQSLLSRMGHWSSLWWIWLSLYVLLLRFAPEKRSYKSLCFIALLVSFVLALPTHFATGLFRFFFSLFYFVLLSVWKRDVPEALNIGQRLILALCWILLVQFSSPMMLMFVGCVAIFCILPRNEAPDLRDFALPSWLPALALSTFLFLCWGGINYQRVQVLKARILSQRHEQVLRLKLPHAHILGPQEDQNGADSYWELLGRPTRRPGKALWGYFFLRPQDALQIQKYFDLQSSDLAQMPELLERYKPQLTQLRGATHSTFVHYTNLVEVDSVSMNTALAQQLNLLMLAEAFQQCPHLGCEQEMQMMLENAQYIQDLQAQGLLMTAMVSYRLSYIWAAVWNKKIYPQRYNSEQWQYIQKAWHNLGEAEQKLLPEIVQNELLLFQSSLLASLPQNWGIVEIRHGEESVFANTLPQQIWRFMLHAPHILEAVKQVTVLQTMCRKYLNQAVHKPELWEAIETQEKNLKAVSPLSAPPIHAALGKIMAHRALRSVWATHLALQAQAEKTSCYPLKQSSLIQNDPYRDAPLVYRYTQGQYRLYAVGPNQKDDGGGQLYSCFTKECVGEERVLVSSKPYPACAD